MPRNLVLFAAVGLVLTGCPTGHFVGAFDATFGTDGSSNGGGDGSTSPTGDGGVPYDQIGIDCTVDAEGDDSCPTGLSCTDLSDGVSECSPSNGCEEDTDCGSSVDTADGGTLQNFCLDGVCFQGCDPNADVPCGRTDFLCQPNGGTLFVCQPDCTQQDSSFCEDYQGYPSTFCNNVMGIPQYGLCTPIGQDCTDGGLSECAMDQVCAPFAEPAFPTTPLTGLTCVSDCRGLGGPTVKPIPDAGCDDSDGGCVLVSDAGCDDSDGGCVLVSDAGCDDPDAGCMPMTDAGCDPDAGCMPMTDAGCDPDAGCGAGVVSGDGGSATDGGSSGPNPEDDGDDAGIIIDDDGGEGDAGVTDAGVDAGLPDGGCLGNSDCTSGACVMGDAGNGVCIPCPFGYACDVSDDSTAGSCLVQGVPNYGVCSQEQQCPQTPQNDCISVNGPPTVGAPGSICLQECQQDSDCPSAPGPQVCQIPLTTGNACGIPCTLRTNCPTGTTCQAVSGTTAGAFCLGM